MPSILALKTTSEGSQTIYFLYTLYGCEKEFFKKDLLTDDLLMREDAMENG